VADLTGLSLIYVQREAKSDSAEEKTSHHGGAVLPLNGIATQYLHKVDVVESPVNLRQRGFSGSLGFLRRQPRLQAYNDSLIANAVDASLSRRLVRSNRDTLYMNRPRFSEH